MVVAGRSPEWRVRFRSQFYKTKLCRFFARDGCRHGEDCPYAHNTEDLVDTPDLKKTSICTDWQQGQCNRPPGQCPYAHGDEELCLTPAFLQRPLSRRLQALVDNQRAPGADSNSSDNQQDADSVVGERPAVRSVMAGWRGSGCGNADAPARARHSQRRRRNKQPPLADRAHPMPLKISIADSVLVPAFQPAAIYDAAAHAGGDVPRGASALDVAEAAVYDAASRVGCDTPCGASARDVAELLLRAMPDHYED